jgi:acyl dehydratase
MNPSLGTPGVVLAHPFMVMALIGAVVVSATAAANNLCCPEVALETPPPETASTLDAQAQA